MKQIRTLRDLVKAREKRRSVVCPSMRCFSKPCPAAFVMNYTGDILHRLITAGLFVHQPKK